MRPQVYTANLGVQLLLFSIAAVTFLRYLCNKRLCLSHLACRCAASCCFRLAFDSIVVSGITAPFCHWPACVTIGWHLTVLSSPVWQDLAAICWRAPVFCRLLSCNNPGTIGWHVTAHVRVLQERRAPPLHRAVGPPHSALRCHRGVPPADRQPVCARPAQRLLDALASRVTHALARRSAY